MPTRKCSTLENIFLTLLNAHSEKFQHENFILENIKTIVKGQLFRPHVEKHR